MKAIDFRVKTIESRGMVDISDEARERTLARFAEHRRAWDQNPALRELYGRWYGRVRGCLPPSDLGPWIEVGSGPGFGRNFIPAMELSDLVKAPWHDRQMAAETLSVPDESVGALVLFDVLHHLCAPAKFFSEASRVLRKGGRIVLCEPHISALSWPVYHFLHEEPVILGVDPLAEQGGPGKDPFDSNQAIPTILFGKRRAEFAAQFPALRIQNVEHLAGLAYPSSGGFSRAPLLPLPVWKALHRFESLIPPAAFRWIGFRLLAVIEKI